MVDIESDSIMAAVTVLHDDQYFKTLIDTDEVDRLNLKVGDDVVIGAKSSDVILFESLNTILTYNLNITLINIKIKKKIPFFCFRFFGLVFLFGDPLLFDPTAFCFVIIVSTGRGVE